MVPPTMEPGAGRAEAGRAEVGGAEAGRTVDGAAMEPAEEGTTALGFTEEAASAAVAVSSGTFFRKGLVAEAAVTEVSQQQWYVHVDFHRE